jgi:hypothetical protein
MPKKRPLRAPPILRGVASVERTDVQPESANVRRLLLGLLARDPDVEG